jgi:hypothetical protein
MIFVGKSFYNNCVQYRSKKNGRKWIMAIETLEVYSLNTQKPDGDYELIASATWDEENQKIIWSKDSHQHWIENTLSEKWIYNYAKMELGQIKPTDGKKFFYALGTFSGAYLRSRIKVDGKLLNQITGKLETIQDE